MTTNNKLGARQYGLEFKSILQAVYSNRAYFGDFFGGSIEAVDGVQHNENAFYVKTSDIAVAVNTYDKEANVAFGTGTASSTRFGDRTEVIYTDTPAPYTWEYAIHEGIDRFTVNNDLDAAVADRLELQAQAKVNQFNAHHGAFISANAGESITGADSETVADLFNELSAHFVNIGAIGTKVAKVNTEVYNLIMDSPLTTTAKSSRTDIDRGEVPMFKGFEIDVTPDALFEAGETIYAYVVGVAKAFTGISTARTIESEDFDGVALQAAGRAGEFILEDNKQAVVKVTGVPAPVVAG